MKAIKLCLFFAILLVPSFAYAEELKEELTVKEKKELISKVARDEKIPAEILKAIAMAETNFMQYKDGKPLVTEDGGIGIMQITADEAELERLNLNKEQLKYDTEYNIKAGAKILKDKWNLAGKKIPKINTHNPEIFEHWYFAVMAYNGVSYKNDPNKSSNTYQEKVFKYIEDNGLIDISEFPTFETGYEDGSLKFKNTLIYDWKIKETYTMSFLTPGKKVVTSSQVNLRSEPETTPGNVIKQIGSSQPLEILEAPQESERLANFFSFYKVKVGGNVGYIASSYLSYLSIPHIGHDVIKRDAVGRLIIRKDTKILTKSKKGTVVSSRIVKKGEMLRLFGVTGTNYFVGNNRENQEFVEHNPEFAVAMIGRLEIKGKAVMYNKNGDKLTQAKIWDKGNQLRVFDYDDKYYYVGGSAVLLKTESNVTFYLGYATPQVDTPLYKADGTFYKTLSKGMRYRVYKINDDRYDLGNGYFVYKENVRFLPH